MGTYPTNKMGYAGPDYCIVRESLIPHPAADSNAAADTKQAAYTSWCKGKLLGARAVIGTAGTATTAGFTIKVGTTSVGTIVCGTTAALGAVEGTITATAFSKGGTVNAHNINSDDGLVADIFLLWERTFDESE